MLGRVGKVHRRCGFGDEADQALALLHAGGMDGGAVEAFGGEQLQRVVGAPQIDRAHLGHHVGGDDGYELVEARLRALLLRHDLAQAAQQNPGAAGGERRHQLRSLIRCGGRIIPRLPCASTRPAYKWLRGVTIANRHKLS